MVQLDDREVVQPRTRGWPSTSTLPCFPTYPAAPYEPLSLPSMIRLGVHSYLTHHLRSQLCDKAFWYRRCNFETRTRRADKVALLMYLLKATYHTTLKFRLQPRSATGRIREDALTIFCACWLSFWRVGSERGWMEPCCMCVWAITPTGDQLVQGAGPDPVRR
jgi:hypothetical protein